MSKYKIGDKVWVRGTLNISDNGSYWVNVKCHHAIRDEGECDLKVSASQLKPDVTFKWSPAKAKKQADFESELDTVKRIARAFTPAKAKKKGAQKK